MIKILDINFYFKTAQWGWYLYGIGYKSKWFFGLSISAAK